MLYKIFKEYDGLQNAEYRFDLKSLFIVLKTRRNSIYSKMECGNDVYVVCNSALMKAYLNIHGNIICKFRYDNKRCLIVDRLIS